MMYRIVLRVFLSLAFAFLTGGFLQAADYVIVVDTSGSMTNSVSQSDEQKRIIKVQDALRIWLQDLPLGSRLTLISFNSGIQSQREFIFRNKLDPQPALSWCDRIDEEAEAHKTGKTHIWTTLRKALEVATRYAKENPEQTAQVRVFTDGEDNEGVTTFLEVVEDFPLVDGKSIQGNLVVLGDLQMDVKTQRDVEDHPGFRLRHDPDFEILLYPFIEWRPKELRVGEEMIAYENTSSIYKTYSWSVDGQPVSTNKVLRHTFTNGGKHTIRLKVEGLKDGREHSQVSIQVSDPYKPPPLQPQILHWNPVNPMPMQSVRFFGRSLGHPVAYKWEIDGETQGKELDFEWKFASEGEFSVVFSAQDESGKWFHSDPKTIIVREPSPIVNFRANPKTYYHKQVVQFANESQGNFVSFHWDFGDSQTSAERSPQHQYENDGNDPKTFRVQLVGKLSNGQEIRSTIYNLTILPSPPTIPSPQIPPTQASIGLDNLSKIEVGQTVRFLDESIGLIQSYQWNFNDEGSSMERHPEFAFQTPGDKTITLTVQGSGEDQSSDSLLIAISPEPPKGWLQRFWWILIPAALFLWFVFGKILRKIQGTSNGPIVDPYKKMRVEISEVLEPKKSDNPNAGQNFNLLKTFVLEMLDKIYLSQADAADDGAGDEFVCDLPAKGCSFQRHPDSLIFFSTGDNRKPDRLKSSSTVEVTDDFGVKKTLQVDISEETMPGDFLS